MKPCIILKNISPAGTHLPITCAIRRDLLFARQTILYFTMFLRGIIFQKTLAKKFWNARYSGNFSRAAPMGTSILYRNLGKLSASDFPSLADNKGLLSSSQPFQNLKHILTGFSAFVKWVFSKEGKLYHFVYALSNLVHGHFFIKPLWLFYTLSDAARPIPQGFAFTSARKGIKKSIFQARIEDSFSSLPAISQP